MSKTIHDIPLVAIQDNYYINREDRDVYELLSHGRNCEMQTYPQHIISEEDFRIEMGLYYTDGQIDQAINNTKHLADACNADIAHAEMTKYTGSMNILNECFSGAIRLGIDLDDEKYAKRLDRELKLINEKDYIDYFLIVTDLVRFAKSISFVGPSRGSSAGSLVCYLLGITEIDPIRFGLLFERFIDINRFDLPDIDVDFQDTKRDKIIKYLEKKYGHDNVRMIATIGTYKPKSAIGDFAKALDIPVWETEDVKGAIIERSGGDARAAMCIADTFIGTEPGKKFIDDYPAMKLVEKIEGHANFTGTHAAGVIVCNEPLYNYCGVNTRDNTIMLDKKDAEKVGLLKIDCLGLRTLSILADTADLIGMKYDEYYTLPLDDEKTFAIFNNMRLSGVFQYEGQALQILTKQMGIHNFNDVAVITALARPGALNSGGAARYVKYRTGVEEPSYFNDMHKNITSETYGIVVYQEQMMEIARQIGDMSWEDVSDLRKAASKSLGDEFFSRYKDKFMLGATTVNELSEEEAGAIWNDISHSGSWSFNKSHAISYGLISYWTAYMKANHPLEFYVSSLNNARDNEHAIKLLRDMVVNDGINYKPIDPDKSGVKWSIADGIIVGGLTNIKGIGPAKANIIIKSRTGKASLTPALYKALFNPITDFDILFPTKHYWGFLFDRPIEYGLQHSPIFIDDIEQDTECIFVGKLIDRNLRSLNEYVFLQKRDGELVEEYEFYLNFTLEDDTGSIMCTISRWDYEKLGGKTIAEHGKINEDWYLVKGTVKGDWRKVNVEHIINLNTWKENNANFK